LTSDDKPVEWHRVTESGLMNEFVAEKTEIDPTVNQYETDKGYDVYEEPLTGRRLQAEFASMGNRKDGLWALRKHEKAELIAEGVFGRPVLCLSGEWIVVAKTPTGKMWNVPNGVVRIHLPDKRMFDVDLPPADNFDPVAWIEARKRVLLYRQRDPDGKVGPKTPEFHIVDPLTGAHEKVEGEFRPFFDARRHPLQSTGSPNEFWGTLHSSIVDPKLHTTTLGRFDSSSFRFTPLVSFPDVEFDSAGVCVDEKSQQIWVNVNGDLLSVSLPR
jgi:hypothetical protein